MSDPSAPLAPFWQGALIVAFGAAMALFVFLFGRDPMPLFDLLLISASLSALVTAGLWLWLIAASHSRGWSLAFAFTFWIPYVNFVVASIFARRYWSQGARTPALLAIAGMVGQTLVALRMLTPNFTAPV